MKKKQTIADPYFEREKQKYGKPIPSREYILQYLEEAGKPISYKKLLAALKLSSSVSQEALKKRLRAMERDGQLMQNRRGNYCLINKLDLIAGRVESHPDGYGFVLPFDGGEDLFLSAKQMRGVLHQDHVLVREISGSSTRRREAAVVQINERTIRQVVGRFFAADGLFFVEPDNKRIIQNILIPVGNQGAAQLEDIVVVDLLLQENMRAPLVGKIVEILGQQMAPGLEIDIAIRSFELPHLWPEALLKEIEHFDKTVTAKDIKGRIDLRELPFVTIDGEDAQDFDDAVYCQHHTKASENLGWILYVAIADVSHYVQVGSALDQEACLRGNSVYFPGKVIPMLPEVLSNNLCSLKPSVDRLCIICEMQISEDGELKQYKFYEGVIHSHARLTYTEVAHVLKTGSSRQKTLQPPLISHLQELYQSYLMLRKARQKRGAIDFELVETRIVFGDQKKIKEIIPLVRNEAHKLIEECMLVANVSAAKFLVKHKMPGLFRVHAPPSPAKLTDLRQFLSEFGLYLHGADTPEPIYYTELLQKIKDRLDAQLIQTVLLRSLSQAVYLPENEGHFGLAYSEYAHFTSPIRRYPDLLLHRAICHILNYKHVKGFAYDEKNMLQIGEHCSMTERRADDATRSVVDWLKCEYMQDRIGEVFDGVITSVTAFGVFVELQSVYVEGLVHVTALKNDYYHYDPLRHFLRGERTNMTYRLGDRIRVRVMRVDLDSKKIDFELA